MRGLIGIAVVVALASPAVAAPKIVSLGSDSTADADPVAACGALAASPAEAGWTDRGVGDKQIFLDGAKAACDAALAAAPDSAEAKTWLARVDILIGRANEAGPLLEEAAAAGNMFAAYLLSGLLDNSIDDGVEDDAARSIELLKQASDGGFLPATVALAGRYETGKGVDTDWSEAARLYGVAADAGDAFATYKLGVLNQNGTGVEQDYARAAELFQQAADAGEPLGYDGLGELYQFGHGLAVDLAKAASIYQQGADQGEPQSETALAYLYEQGQGVEQDYDKSFALLTDAANQGYGFGQAALALHYLFGEGVAVDEKKAFDLAYAAAAQQVVYAQGIVGYMFAEGLGTPRDLSQALTYLQKGADGGDQYSSTRLEVTNLEVACEDQAGSQYEPNGIGHGVDFEAIDADAAIAACRSALDANPGSVGDGVWLARAYMRAERYDDALPLVTAGADAGNVLAKTLYADLLAGGNGVARDAERALQLYRDAADADFAPAQLALGRAYAQGELVAADVETARSWLKRALDNGLDAAQDDLDALGGSSTAVADDADLTQGFGREGPAY